MINLGLNLLKYAPRAFAGVRSILGDPVKSSGLITGGILGGKATNDTINSGILGDTNLMEEGMSFFSSPAINYLKDIRNTPSGSVLAPDQDAIDKENEFNKELNTKITTASEDNQSNILITPEVEQQSGLLSTPENNPIDFSNTTPLPDQSLLSDYIMTASEAEEPTTTDEGLLSETKNPYYSVLAENVLDMNFTSGTGDQILNQIINMPGVKKSELEDTGLSTFLSGKSKVTKEELDNYILENNISTKINDVILGQDKGYGYNLEQIDETKDGSFLLDYATTLRGAIINIENDEEEYNNFTKYLAQRDPTLTSLKRYEEGTLDEKFKEYYFTEYLKDKHNLKAVPTTKPTVYNSQTLSGGTNYKELLISVPTDDKPYIPAHFAGQVPEGHNLIAHARFNDREIDGQKTLFIEEIQSDLHQQGRKEGYGSKIDISPIINNFNNYLDNIKNKYPDIVNSENYKGLQSDINNLKEANSVAIIDAIKDGIPYFLNDLNDEIESLGHDSKKDGFDLKGNYEFWTFDYSEQKNVPDAPFKKNWHELAIKRIFKYAVDNGYDAISLTPGSIQSDRYDLSKQISKVEVSKAFPNDPDNTYLRLKAYDIEGKSLVINQNIYPENLDNYVGKDLADKINKDRKEKDYLKDGSNLEYSGLDLKVGGEGMKGFYDKMIPSYLKKFTKKFNSNVESKNLSYSSSLMPDQIKINQVYESGDFEYKIISRERTNPKTGKEEMVYTILQQSSEDPWEMMMSYKNIENAKATLSRYLDEKEKEINVPFIKITPEMKQEIGKKGINIAKLNSGLLSVA